MSDTANQDPFSEQTAAFQKMWTESMAKMAQSAFTFPPNSAPEETIKEIRQGIFQALAHSWDEFMRSPQFLDGMKQWMEQAINFRAMTNDFLSKVRHETQEPTQRDIEGILQALRHLETRVLNRVEELGEVVESLQTKIEATNRRPPRRTSTAKSSKSSPGKHQSSARKKRKA